MLTFFHHTNYSAYFLYLCLALRVDRLLTTPAELLFSLLAVLFDTLPTVAGFVKGLEFDLAGSVEGLEFDEEATSSS